ncbi:2-amino-4-hydroxy-6-hydroxymethyldihydropteridine diphosphokinase [Nakamurella sp. YIM 132087]|uniref:2-amino-4-hydroxy-6-hydroxymethyldihydropteridine diphosphokinase n=1 Tax=Nakamurella alba TaxID=2665158 RepID=A0A7K1FK66_9ACTN|nr:2-amino-4-hydroxy-6-hydroxymethyldihydropteridine diphosphokinase [Nakamurella alba]MTD14535.1 2-amino-4-hydroxy-6-hydroxymethyldihydropteridine diphosphokinase [Nakamurella alba]
MSTAVLSLGSNLGDSAARLSEAVRTLGRRVRAVSSVYRTPPWGPVPQDDFLNIVVIADDESLDAGGWLALCHRLEDAAGRTREVRWGPRTLDADVVVVDEDVFDDEDLVLPHPRAHERAFVLVPWAEIDPTAELPGHGPIAGLLERMPDAELAGIRRVGHVD